MTRATKERLGRKGTNRRLAAMVLAALSVNDCSMPMRLGGWVSGSSEIAAATATATATTTATVVTAESVNGRHLRQRQRQNEKRVEKRRRSGIFPGPYEAEDYRDPRNRPETAFAETTPSLKSSSVHGAESGTDWSSSATEGFAQLLGQEETGTQQVVASSLRHRKNEEIMNLFPEEFWFFWDRNDINKNGNNDNENDNDNGNEITQGRVQNASIGCGHKYGKDKFLPKAFKSDKKTKNLKRMVNRSRERSGDADSGSYSNSNNNNRYLSNQRAINYDSPTLPPIECPEDPQPAPQNPSATTSPRVPSSQTKAPSGATDTNNGNSKQLTPAPAQNTPWKDPTGPPATLPIGETIFEPTLTPTRKPSPTPRPVPSPTRAPSEGETSSGDSTQCSANEKCTALSLTGVCCPSTSGFMLQCCDAYGVPSSAPGGTDNGNGNLLPTRSPSTVIGDENNGSGNGNFAPATSPSTEGGIDGTGNGNFLPTTSPATGMEDGNGNGNNAGNGNDAGNNAGNGSDTGTNDEETANELCNRVKTQNHSAILAKQEQSTVGPSFLYSVAVSIVHEEAQASPEQVLVYLNTLNVPIALAISGCQYQLESFLPNSNNDLNDFENNGSTSSTRQSNTGDGQRRLQVSDVEQSESNSTNTPDIAVEYSEVEAWRENPASSPIGENSVCFDAPTGDGIACNVFKSRVIIFLSNQQQQVQSETTATTRNRSGSGATEDVLRDRINDALTDYGYLLSAFPGIISVDVDSIVLDSSPQPPSSAPEPPGSAPDGADSGPDTNSLTDSSLSADTTTIIGSVAACLGGLLLGGICVVWCKRSRYYDVYTHKHSRFDDSSEDYWPPGSHDLTKDDPEGETPTNDIYNNSDRNSFISIQPIDMGDNTLSPNRKTRFAVGGMPEDEGYLIPPNYVRKPNNNRSHRGRKINRVDTLYDKGLDEERCSAFQGTMPILSTEWSTDDDTDARETVDDSFDDELHNNNSYPFASCGVGIPPFSWHPPCSSPTCTICEDRRMNGIGRDEYSWLKMMLPPNAEKIPTCDPTRACLCDDTVAL